MCAFQKALSGVFPPINSAGLSAHCVSRPRYTQRFSGRQPPQPRLSSFLNFLYLHHFYHGDKETAVIDTNAYHSMSRRRINYFLWVREVGGSSLASAERYLFSLFVKAKARFHEFNHPCTALLLGFFLSSSFWVCLVFWCRLHNKKSDEFQPKYRASTLLRIHSSGDVILNTSSIKRLYTAFAMHLVGICPNITQFTVLTY